MSRRNLRVVPSAPDADLQCLLCGTDCEAAWDGEAQELLVPELCPGCIGVVQAVADRVAARVVAEIATGVIHVPGQLDLDDAR